jgi:hypothetical protein
VQRHQTLHAAQRRHRDPARARPNLSKPYRPNTTNSGRRSGVCTSRSRGADARRRGAERRPPPPPEPAGKTLWGEWMGKRSAAPRVLAARRQPPSPWLVWMGSKTLAAALCGLLLQIGR